MKKLSLAVEELNVESFETAKADPDAGTVKGYFRTDSTCLERICTCTVGFETACDYTCGTCPNQCATDAGCLTHAGYPGC